jgi:hypothetical protein
MGRPMTGGQRRIDVIANQKASAGNGQAVKLSVQFWDTARMAELMHRLERDDEIEARANFRCPIGFLKSEGDFLLGVRKEFSIGFSRAGFFVPFIFAPGQQGSGLERISGDVPM